MLCYVMLCYVMLFIEEDIHVTPYNVCQFLRMADISMRSFIEEDIHVTP